MEGWIVGIGGALSAIIASVVAGMKMRSSAKLEAEKLKLEEKLQTQRQDADIDSERETATNKMLRQIIKDLQAERRTDEAECEARIKVFQAEIKELRESERRLFAETSRQQQLIEILKQRDTKMRHGLADHGIGVKSVEGPLVPGVPGRDSSDVDEEGNQSPKNSGRA